MRLPKPWRKRMCAVASCAPPWSDSCTTARLPFAKERLRKAGGECNAQTGDRVEAEPDWDSVAPPVPDYDVDRRACKLRVPMRLNFLSADYGELRGQLMAYTEVVGDNPPRHISRIGLESLKNNERTRLYLAGSYCF